MGVPVNITDLSTTAASNSPASSDSIGTSLDDYIRSHAAFIAQLFNTAAIYSATVGGTANAITLTPTPAITAYQAGQQFTFIAGSSNTTATTINISGLGVKNITKNGATALAANDILSGAIVTIEYDGTRFQLVSVNTSNYLAALAEATLASAGTTDLGTAGSNIVKITGTTTITSLGSSAVTTNPIYYVRFTGALILTYNASSLVLPGAANINTVAGDSMIAEYQGSGNWQVLVYQKSTITGSGGAVLATAPTLNQANLVGTTTNDSASAGSVGEYVSSTIVSGSAVSLSNGVAANVTSISLTAGDWDVWIDGYFTGGGTTVFNYGLMSISSTSATLDTTVGKYTYIFGAASGTPFSSLTSQVSNNVGPYRLSLSGTTTIYMVAQAAFTTSTCSAFGIIQARRRR